MPNLLLGVLRPALLAPPAGGVAGYIAQGDELDAMWKTSFPSDTFSATTSFLDDHAVGSGFGNDGVAGYCSRGFDSVTGTASDVADKWTFPTDSVSALLLSIPSFEGFAWGDPGNLGVFGEGTGDAFAPTDGITILTLPTDLVTSDNLAAEVQGTGGGCDYGVAGYFPIDNSDKVGRILLPTFTQAFDVGIIGAGADQLFGTCWVNPTEGVYASRGANFDALPNPVATDEFYKLALPNLTPATPPSMPDVGIAGVGISDHGVAGYVNRGFSDYLATPTDELYKFTYSSQTWSTAPNLPDDSVDNGGFSNQG